MQRGGEGVFQGKGHGVTQNMDEPKGGGNTERESETQPDQGPAQSSYRRISGPGPRQRDVRGEKERTSARPESRRGQHYEFESQRPSRTGPAGNFPRTGRQRQLEP